MKKKILLLCIISLVLFTGCVKKEKLTCTQEETITSPVNVKVESKSVINFEDGYAKSFTTNQVLIFEDEEEAKEYLKSFKEEDDYKINRDGSKVTFDYSKKVDKEEVKTEENTKEYIKKYLEENNYKCK